MLRTQATATGDLWVVRQCVWGDQEGLSIMEIHSITTEMLSGGEGGWELAMTGGEGSRRLRLSSN